MKKRIIMLLLFVIIIGMLVGCEKETSKLEDKPKFNVFFVDEQLKEYIEKVEKNEAEDIDKLYKKIVYDPIKKFASNSEYSGLVNYYVKRPDMNFSILKSKIDILNRENVIGIVEDALNESNEFLSGIDTTVYVFPYEPENDLFKYNSGGVAGFTLGKGKILLSANPTYPSWKIYLSYIVAHEYHHSVWTDQEYEAKSETLLEYLIFEGRADSFANIVCPDAKLAEKRYLSEDQEKELWNKIKSNLDSTDGDYKRKVMFGDNEEFPSWGGYKIGYNIMQGFIKNNPDVSIEDWTSMDAKEILEKSGYEERFQNSN